MGDFETKEHRRNARLYKRRDKEKRLETKGKIHKFSRDDIPSLSDHEILRRYNTGTMGKETDD